MCSAFAFNAIVSPGRTWWMRRLRALANAWTSSVASGAQVVLIDPSDGMPNEPFRSPEIAHGEPVIT